MGPRAGWSVKYKTHLRAIPRQISPSQDANLPEIEFVTR